MRLIVPVDLPTLSEAVAVARSLIGSGVEFGVGPRLLSRSGAAVAATLREFGPVAVDARLSGDPAAVVAAARTHASGGAGVVTLGSRVAPETVRQASDVVRPYGARIAIALEDPPEATSTDHSRGRMVSVLAGSLAGLDVDLMGTTTDIGVVAQVAPSLRVLVTGISTVAEAAEAVQRGAVAAVLAPEAVDVRDPVATVAPFVQAVGGG